MRLLLSILVLFYMLLPCHLISQFEFIHKEYLYGYCYDIYIDESKYICLISQEAPAIDIPDLKNQVLFLDGDGIDISVTELDSEFWGELAFYNGYWFHNYQKYNNGIGDSICIELLDQNFIRVSHSCHPLSVLSARPKIHNNVYSLMGSLFHSPDSVYWITAINQGNDLLVNTPFLFKTDPAMGYVSDWVGGWSENRLITVHAGGITVLASDFDVVSIHRGDTLGLRLYGSLQRAANGEYIAIGIISEWIDNYIANDVSILKFNEDVKILGRDTMGLSGKNKDYIPLLRGISFGDSIIYACAMINFGETYNESVPSSYQIAKFDTDLNIIWLKTIGGNANYVLNGIKADPNGGCLVYGSVKTDLSEDVFNPYVLRIPPDGVLSSKNKLNKNHFDITLLGNPGSNDLKLFSDLPNQIRPWLYVCTINGQILHKSRLNNGILEVPSNGWSPGPYEILVRDEAGNTFFMERWMKL